MKKIIFGLLLSFLVYTPAQAATKTVVKKPVKKVIKKVAPALINDNPLGLKFGGFTVPTSTVATSTAPIIIVSPATSTVISNDQAETESRINTANSILLQINSKIGSLNAENSDILKQIKSLEDNKNYYSQYSNPSIIASLNTKIQNNKNTVTTLNNIYYEVIDYRDKSTPISANSKTFLLSLGIIW